MELLINDPLMKLLPIQIEIKFFHGVSDFGKENFEVLDHQFLLSYFALSTQFNLLSKIYVSDIGSYTLKAGDLT